MKNIINSLILMTMVVLTDTARADVCLLSNGAYQLPYNTNFKIGPLFASVDALNSGQLGSIVLAGAHVWDSTDANGRIGYDAGPASKDCPVASINNFSVGLAYFSHETISSCSVIAGQTGWLGYTVKGPLYAGVIFNLDYAWNIYSSLPDQNQYDAMSVAAHEFGHALGFGHQGYGACGDTSSNCIDNPNTETMNKSGYNGDFCRRTLTTNDAQTANGFY